MLSKRTMNYYQNKLKTDLWLQVCTLCYENNMKFDDLAKYPNMSLRILNEWQKGKGKLNENVLYAIMRIFHKKISITFDDVEESEIFVDERGL